MKKTVILRPAPLLMLFTMMLAKNVLAASDNSEKLQQGAPKVTFLKFVNSGALQPQEVSSNGLKNSVKVTSEVSQSLKNQLLSYLNRTRRYHSFKSSLWKGTAFLLGSARHLTRAAALAVLVDDITHSEKPFQSSTTFYGAALLGASWIIDYLSLTAKAVAYKKEKQLFNLVNALQEKTSYPCVHSSDFITEDSRQPRKRRAKSRQAQPRESDAESSEPKDVQTDPVAENELGKYLKRNAACYACSGYCCQIIADISSSLSFFSLSGGIGVLSFDLFLDSYQLLRDEGFYGLALTKKGVFWGYFPDNLLSSSYQILRNVNFCSLALTGSSILLGHLANKAQKIAEETAKIAADRELETALVSATK